MRQPRQGARSAAQAAQPVPDVGRRSPSAGWYWAACGLLAALFLSPAIVKGAMEPGDMLLGMTPWAAYHDRFPDVRGVRNPQLDVIQQYYPWRVYAASTLREGVLPLWNPHEYCGQPFVGNVLSAVFYPFTWLATVMPVGPFFLLSAWCHLTLLGGGMALLLRDHGLRPASIMAGAAAMMLNTFVIGWLAFPGLSQWTIGWLPLLLFAWRRAYLPRQPRRLAWTALLLALIVVGGHLQIALYCWLAWFVYAAGLTLLDGRRRDLVLYVAVPGALGSALAAQQVLPALTMIRLSGRRVTSYASLSGLAVPPAMLIQLLVPWFYGNNALDLSGLRSGGNYYWGPYINGVEQCIGAGAGALWLSVAGLVWRRERSVRLFGAIALLGVLLGLRTPLYWLFWKFVPGFSAINGLGRAFSLYCFGAAALTGFGVEALSTPERGGPCPRRTGALMLVCTALALMFAFLREAMLASPERRTAFTPELTGYVLGQCGIAVAVTAVVAHVTFHRLHRWAPWLAAVAVAELFVIGFGMHRGVPPAVYFFETRETRLLQTQAPPSRMVGYAAGDPRRAFLDWFPMNTPLAYGLSSPTGTESLTVARYTKLADQCCQPAWTPKLGSPLLSLLGVRYVVSRADLDGVAGLRRVGGERVGVFENPAALPVVFGAVHWRRATLSAMLPAMLQPDFDPRVPLVDSSAPESPRPPGQVAENDVIMFRVARTSPQRWTARGTCPGPTMVVLSETWAPGWQVWRDRSRERAYAADHAFSAVPVPPGAVTLRWVWRPADFTIGLFITLGAAAALAGWVMAAGPVTRGAR